MNSIKPVHVILFCALSLLIHSSVHAETRFVRIELPLKASIEIPRNWWLFSKDLNTSLEASGEATLKLKHLEIPAGKKVNLIRANSRPTSTYAGLSVVANDSEIDPLDVKSFNQEDVDEINSYMHSHMRKVLQGDGGKLIEWLGTKKEMISGHPALCFEYRRSGPKGSVLVSMNRIYLKNMEISFNLSYRESEQFLWTPIIRYMKSSIRLGDNY